VHAVANHYDPVQGQSGFGAVPGNELIDGVFIDAARGWRSEAVEHCQFAMIQIFSVWKAAVVNSADGQGQTQLPTRRNCTTIPILR
jgi:hypothetical protein